MPIPARVPAPYSSDSLYQGVPIYNKVGEVVGVLDIDSKELDTFDDTDKIWLEKITSLVSRQLY
jgi:putative methionine-R-sulfoxide reductase with GAF domain